MSLLCAVGLISSFLVHGVLRPRARRFFRHDDEPGRPSELFGFVSMSFTTRFGPRTLRLRRTVQVTQDSVARVLMPLSFKFTQLGDGLRTVNHALMQRGAVKSPVVKLVRRTTSLIVV